MCHLSTVLSTIRSKTWEHYHLCKLSQDRVLSQTPMLWGQGSIIDPYTRHTVSQHKTSTITMRHSVVVGNKGTKILSPYLSGAPGPICMLPCKVPIWATRVSWPSQASRPLSPREHILIFASMCMFKRTYPNQYPSKMSYFLATLEEKSKKRQFKKKNGYKKFRMSCLAQFPNKKKRKTQIP